MPGDKLSPAEYDQANAQVSPERISARLRFFVYNFLQTNVPAPESWLFIVSFGPAGRRPLVSFFEQPFNPVKLAFHLLNDELQHPDGFVVWMSDFIHHLFESHSFLSQSVV